MAASVRSSGSCRADGARTGFSGPPARSKTSRLANLSGLLHDFGKYTDCFQQMLRTGQGRCQHAIHGAMLAYFGTEGADKKPRLNTVMAAIVGHHAGLADWCDYYEAQ